MIPPAILRVVAAAIGLIAGFPATPACAWEPLRAHPQNPYILEFRGQPTVLRTFAESYSSVTDAGLPFIPYLDVLQRDGMNLTRVWCLGFPPDDAANPGQFLQPWPRTTANGNALDGYGKWDFSAWNEAFFTRLKAFAQAASDRGIVVEFTLFSTFYNDDEWQAGPFHPSNNIQGYGPTNRFDCLRPVDANLLAAQQAAVQRIVSELNGFDNVYFEIQNEPFWNQPGVNDDQEVAFHHEMLDVIRAEEAGLPNRHLVAHNFPQRLATLSADFDVINEHYPAAVPSTTIAGAEALLSNQYFRGRILSLDETHPTDALQTRLESWMFLLGGGGIYDGLDAGNYVYSPVDPSGDNALGAAMRGAVRHIGTYMDNLHVVALRRDLSWLSGGIPAGATVQAMASPGQQYAAYFHHGQSGNQPFQLNYDPIDSSDHSVSLTVTLGTGTWRAVWTRPADLAELHTEEFTHAGGAYTLAPVTYQADVALRIDRTGAGDATPPPSPTGLAAAANADGSIALSWNPVQAADLAVYHIYRAEVAGVPLDAGHRIAVLPPTDTSFMNSSTTVGVTYYYVVSALDVSGNESLANRETSATSALRSLPFGGTPWSVPGVIQAEDFDTGGQDVAYHDLSPANDGGQYRVTESVDIEITSDEGGGHHVSGTEAGEWLQYTVNITTTGEYIVEMRTANDAAGGQVHLEIDGIDVTGAIAIPETGGFATWQTISVPGIELTAGEHVLRLVIDASAPLGIAGAINWVSFTAVQHIGPTANAGPDFEVIDQDGTGVESVTLDASASLEGDSPIVSYVWMRNGEVLANGVNPSLNLALGEHVIELVVTDGNGLSATDEVVVTVSSGVFINGSFEAGFDGWTTSGNLSLQSNSPYVPADGNQLVSFNAGNSTPNAVLSQTFGTIPGRAYFLSFDMGVLAYNFNQQRLQVNVTGATTLLSQSYTISRTGSAIIRWVPINLSFIADSTTTTLTFRDTSIVTNSLDLLLDDVNVTPEILWTLVVESSPESRVNVGVTPPDINGAAGGLTSFSRVYSEGAVATLTAPPSANGYRFQAWLKNGANPDPSAVIRVTMDADYTLTAVYVEGPPIITAQPANVAVAAGSSASFHVTAEGVGPLSYQWRFNGAGIDGAIADTYTIASVGEEHAGTYDVVVSSAGGSTTSNPAGLEILIASLLNGSFEAGFDGWTTSGNLSLQSNAPYVPTDGNQLVSFNDGNLMPNAVLSQAFATIPGQTYFLAFDMGLLAYNYNQQRLQVNVTGNGTLFSQSFTIARVGSSLVRWIPINLSFTANSTATTLTFRDTSTTTNGLDLLLDHVSVTPEILRTLAVESSPVAGVNVAVSPADNNGAAGGLTTFSRVYLDGTVTTLTAPPAANGYNFQAWLKNGVDPNPSPVIAVTMDADYTLTAVYVEGPPVITAQPASVAAAVGSSATFRVAAEGIGPLSYQWRFNGADISGAVSDSYTIASVGQEHAGSYDVVVSGTGGSTTSNSADLTILTASLVNGSFETSFNGWTASGNLSIKTTAPYVPTDGSQLVAFNDGNSPPNAVLAQTFATMPGQTYFLSFDMGVLAYNFNQQRLQLNITGAGTLLDQSFTIARVSSSLVRWIPINLSFTANSTATTLTFRDTSTTTNSLDLLLDHVEISDQMAAASASAPAPQGNLLAARPSITSTAGSVTIHLATQEPGLYELQRSRDLQTWETVSTISPDSADNFAFIDPGPPEKQMFYRIVLHRGTASK